MAALALIIVDIQNDYDACAAKEQEFEGVPIPAETVHRTFMAALSPAYATIMATADFTT
jgi:hypothetical protein